MAEVLPKRQDVPIEKRWNVESVFSSEADWQEAFAKVEAAIPGIAQYKGRLGESGAVLLEAMETLIDTSILYWHVHLYASMLRSGDAADQAAAALVGRVTGLASRFGAASAYFDPEILSIPDERLEQFYRSEPKLALYKHQFDKLRLIKPHVRSAEVEAVLAETGTIRSGPSQLFRSLVDADMQFAEASSPDGSTHKVEQGTISALVEQPNRELRKAAWEAYADGYLGMKNTLAASLIQSFQGYVFNARVRNYDNVLASRMAPNGIPREVFDNLISTFKENLPIWHRYWRLMQKALKVPSLHVYDSPITHGPAALTAVRRKIEWAEGIDMICDGMAPLGSDYVTSMRRGLTEERWVDAWPNLGKGSGAFSSGAPGTHPFIMMNYTNDINSVSTLAHELGHSMHSYLTWQNQPTVYSDYSLFVAETASNFDQALVRAHLLATTDDPAFRLQILEEAFSNFFRYMLVMPTLARFELDSYTKLEQGEALTADSMSATIVSLFREAFGESVVIDEPRVGITWAKFGHLYSSYYVYQYATGISAANALVQQVLTEGQLAAERYLNFLKAGGSVYPLDALKTAGIDMTTTAPITAAFQVLNGFVDDLEALVG